MTQPYSEVVERGARALADGLFAWDELDADIKEALCIKAQAVLTAAGANEAGKITSPDSFLIRRTNYGRWEDEQGGEWWPSGPHAPAGESEGEREAIEAAILRTWERVGGGLTAGLLTDLASAVLAALSTPTNRKDASP